MKKAENLNEFLAQEITYNGPMTFGAFMSHALCHPDFGYYMTRDPFGVNGDFTTAPEISQMFGEMIGAWVVDIWGQMGRPQRFNLIECGAGRGTLMADIIRIAKAVDGFSSAVQVMIIDSSERLRDLQRKTLKDTPVKWIDGVDACSVNEPCIILGNEFLDALSVEQIRFMNQVWEQHYINYKDEGFVSIWQKSQKDIEHLFPEIKAHATIYELAPERHNFINDCTQHLKASGGAALFIDYGYAKTTGGDTVQAVQRHEYVPVLNDVGECDITAHVDFESLLSIAQKGGVKTQQLVTQCDFLRSLGIEHRANTLKNTALKQVGAIEGKLMAQNIQNDLNRLIGEKQMGQLFKVMCFHNGFDFKPAGF